MNAIRDQFTTPRFDPERSRANQDMLTDIYDIQLPATAREERDEPSAVILWIIFGLLTPIFMGMGWIFGILIQAMMQ